MKPSTHIAEVIRALAVLALVFLNFGHAPLSAAPVDAGWSVAFQSICGDAPDGDTTGQSGCHACRIGSGADLPPVPPCIAAPAAIAPVQYTWITPQPPAIVGYGLATARGPPVLV